jgi:hypothetical protein
MPPAGYQEAAKIPGANSQNKDGGRDRDRTCDPYHVNVSRYPALLCKTTEKARLTYRSELEQGGSKRGFAIDGLLTGTTKSPPRFGALSFGLGARSTENL